MRVLRNDCVWGGGLQASPGDQAPALTPTLLMHECCTFFSRGSHLMPSERSAPYLPAGNHLQAGGISDFQSLFTRWDSRRGRLSSTGRRVLLALPFLLRVLHPSLLLSYSSAFGNRNIFWNKYYTLWHLLQFNHEVP